MYLFWGTFETLDINLSETQQGDILLPGSGGKKQEPCAIMSCSRNFVLMSFSIKRHLCWCLLSLPKTKTSRATCSFKTSTSIGTMPKPTFSFRIHTSHLKVFQVYRNTAKSLLWYGPAQAWKTTIHAWHWGPILRFPIRQKPLQKELQLGQSLTGKQKTKQQKSPNCQDYDYKNGKSS